MGEPNLNANLLPDNLKPVQFSQLTWEEKAALMWSWYWRTFIISVLTLWLSNFFGTLIGSYIKILVGDLNSLAAQGVIFIIAAAIGYLGVHPLIKLLTTYRIGDYQIVILKKR